MLKKVWDKVKATIAFFDTSEYTKPSPVTDDKPKNKWKVCGFCQGDIEKDKGEKQCAFGGKHFHVPCMRDLRKTARQKGIKAIEDY